MLWGGQWRSMQLLATVVVCGLYGSEKSLLVQISWPCRERCLLRQFAADVFVSDHIVAALMVVFLGWAVVRVQRYCA